MAASPPPRPPGSFFGVPNRPDVAQSSKVPSSAVIKMLVGFGLAMIVAVALPRVVHGGTGTPPIGILVASGALITALTTGALWFAIQRDLGLPQRVALYTVGYNALIVLVKFVLAPLGVYQVNQSVTLESFLPFNNLFGASLAAGLVFVLYLGVYALIYRIFRRGVVVAAERKKRRVTSGGVGLSFLAGGLLLAGTGGAFLLIPLLVAVSATYYLRYVFSSAVALEIVLALVATSVLAGLAFRSVSQRAEMYGNAAVLVS
ncbi:MAG TPA: hypothetical protein VKK30_04955, partial [Actinomycetota bacterium]|nr:hypothetical protein [Actinomycetota bacterium]